MGRRYIPGGALPFAIVGIVAALFLLFVYGYPRLFPRIEASSTEHFTKNAPQALAAGNVGKALRIAGRAAKVRPLDPMAYTVYGRMLLASGKPEEALAQLTSAVGLQKELVGEAYRETREPFYFAPARLTLGEYYLKENQLSLAAVNFELARASAPTADAPYAEYRAAQYKAYAGLGLWARALEFGEPSDGELDGLDAEELAQVARVCEGRQDWKQVRRVGERLLTREGMAAQGHHLLGRIGLAEGQHATAADHLRQAVAGGYAEAAFFLGMAFEKAGETTQALEAFLATKPEDVYYPFALAKAFAVLSNFPEEKREAAAAIGGEVLVALDNEIAKLRLQKAPSAYDTYQRFTPLAILTSSTYFAAGGRFPVLILWEDGKAPAADPAHIAVNASQGGDYVLLQRGTNTLLQVQWVENRVNWDGVERLPADGAELPGWIDTARDWFKLRPDYVAQVQQDDTGNSFLSLPRVTWLTSVPVPERDGVGYLFAGRVRCLPDRASLTWQAFDTMGQVLIEDNIAEGDAPDVWTWHAGYTNSRLSWDTLRVQLSVLPRAGAVGFDDVMLVEILEPDAALPQ